MSFVILPSSQGREGHYSSATLQLAQIIYHFSDRWEVSWKNIIFTNFYIQTLFPTWSVKFNRVLDFHSCKSSKSNCFISTGGKKRHKRKTSSITFIWWYNNSVPKFWTLNFTHVIICFLSRQFIQMCALKIHIRNPAIGIFCY